MMMSVIMGLIVVLIVIALYIGSGGWRTYGGLKGVWKWLKQGGLSVPARQHNSGPLENRGLASDVVAVLDEIYHEFQDTVSKQRDEFRQLLLQKEEHVTEQFNVLNRRISQLEDELLRLQTTFGWFPEQHQQTGSSAYEKHSDTAQEARPLEPMYFRILDLLHLGVSVDKIAQDLGITVNEVNLVRQIMMQPSRQL